MFGKGEVVLLLHHGMLSDGGSDGGPDNTDLGSMQMRTSTEPMDTGNVGHMAHLLLLVRLNSTEQQYELNTSSCCK